MIARLFSSCLFSHDHPQMVRNAENKPVWQCSRCQGELGPVLASKVYDGPAKAQAEVLGKPVGVVTRERKRNVAEFKRESQR